jgi:hypothetical protein
METPGQAASAAVSALSQEVAALAELRAHAAAAEAQAR